MSLRLVKFIEHGIEIFFLDESMFHQGMNSGHRTWQKKDEKIKFYGSSTRGNSFTVIGIYSSKRGLIYYKVHKGSINIDLF
jgi:hypothetical protein